MIWKYCVYIFWSISMVVCWCSSYQWIYITHTNSYAEMQHANTDKRIRRQKMLLNLFVFFVDLSRRFISLCLCFACVAIFGHIVDCAFQYWSVYKMNILRLKHTYSILMFDSFYWNCCGFVVLLLLFLFLFIVLVSFYPSIFVMMQHFFVMAYFISPVDSE